MIAALFGGVEKVMMARFENGSLGFWARSVGVRERVKLGLVQRINCKCLLNSEVEGNIGGSGYRYMHLYHYIRWKGRTGRKK
jgi:hypothetical protein